MGHLYPLAGMGQSNIVKFGNFDRNGDFQAENRSLTGKHPTVRRRFTPPERSFQGPVDGSNGRLGPVIGGHRI